MKHDPFDWRSDPRMRERDLSRMPMAEEPRVLRLDLILLFVALAWVPVIGGLWALWTILP